MNFILNFMVVCFKNCGKVKKKNLSTNYCGKIISSRFSLLAYTGQGILLWHESSVTITINTPRSSSNLLIFILLGFLL